MHYLSQGSGALNMGSYHYMLRAWLWPAARDYDSLSISCDLYIFLLIKYSQLLVSLGIWLTGCFMLILVTAWQDVWQGTQLLAIDVAAALGLLRRAVIGDELTEKEKKYLRRTLTDMASVVPIGVLMLLPVSTLAVHK